MDNIFILQNVCKKYSDDIDPVCIGSLEIPRGRIVAILGRSGCGKTTLLNILALMDYLRPGEGEIIYRPLEGDEVRFNEWRGLVGELNRSRFRRKRFGFVFQNDHLMDNFSPIDNSSMPNMLNGYASKKDLAKNVMEKFGLKDKINSNPGDLSGGERSRIGVIRALLHEPEVIFADEPTADLDKALEHEILSALIGWKKAQPESNRTLIFVTHNLALAMEWADFYIVFPANCNKKANDLPRFDEHIKSKNDIQQEIRDLLKYPKTSLLQSDHNNRSVPPEHDHYRKKYQEFFNDLDGKQQASFRKKVCHNVRLIWYDFFRHRRRKGSILVMWGPPILVILTILFMIASVFFISGMKKGTSALFQKELSNPFLWLTYVGGENIYSVDSRLYRDKAGFHRLYLSFRNPYNNRQIDLHGRSMNSNDKLLPRIRKLLRSPKGIAKAQILRDNNTFGIIITENGLSKLGLHYSKIDPREVEFVFRVSGGKGLGGAEDNSVYVPIPILGIAERLPFGDFILSEGFVQTHKMGRLNNKLLTDHVCVEFVPSLEEFELEDLRIGLRKSLVELKSKLGVNVDLDEVTIELVESKRKVFVSLKKKVYFFVFDRLVDASVKALGSKKAFFLDFGSSCLNLEYNAAKANYRHWSFIMEQNIEVVERFIDACQKEDLFVDTSIVWKAKSLQRSAGMFNTLFDGTKKGIIALSIAIILLIIWFDSYRRIHNIGVFFAMGASIFRYLGMAFTQIILICVISLFATIYLGETLLFDHLCNTINRLIEWINPNQGMMVFQSLSIKERFDLSWKIVLPTCILVSILKFLIFNKSPAELIRYQD